MHVVDSKIKMQIATAYSASHVLLGCVALGHCFGIWLKFAGATSGVGKLAVLHHGALCLALATPKNMCVIALYL